MGQTPAGSVPARAEEGLSPESLAMPLKRPADSLGRPFDSFGLADYALRHLPNTSPPNVNPSPAASLAMPLKRPADSLGRPFDSFGLADYALRHLPNTSPPKVNPSPNVPTPKAPTANDLRQVERRCHRPSASRSSSVSGSPRRCLRMAPPARKPR